MGTPAKDRKPDRIDRSPPPAIIERPGAASPSPDAQWIEGYWTWNEIRKDFDWVTGVWRVAPASKFWVSGYWRHDPAGWSRVPGFWSNGRAAPSAGREAAPVPPERSFTRPPPERPREIVGPPPGPAYFYIPGEYVPQGSLLVWKPGFWYRSQPGFEWMPAHWVQKASGWTFREGYWSPLGRSSSQPQGNGPAAGGATLTAAADPGRSRADATANSVRPVSTEAPARYGPSPAGGAEIAASGSELSPDAQGTGDAESDALAAEKKPSETAAPAPVSVHYAPGPAYYNSWGGMQWNGGAPFGGILSRFLPY
jgi:hypothetical protein